MKFYGLLGFEVEHKAANDAVAVVRNAHGVELNLVYNANDDRGGKNILMDVGEKYPGYTHVALRVSSIKAAIEALRENGVRITQGPVSFGRDPSGGAEWARTASAAPLPVASRSI